MVCKLVGIIFILQFGLLNVSVGSPWATPEQEALDELHDAEIFKAVVSSMAQWYSRHNVHIRQKRAESSACYGDLGCFEATGPFSYLEFVPSSPEEVGTRFFLYPGRRSGERGKRNSITGPAPLDVPADDTETVWKWAGEGGFNTSNPTKVIVHGFGSSCSHVWVYEMRSALMAVEECNIICVDWENGALIPNYVRASANTRLVGAQLAQLLKGLNDKVGLPIDRMHLIGFSLGAHVAGFAGQQLGGNISRITGLDPAGPLFESQDPRARLDSTDAKFVDVIHSNGETLILGGLGSWQPMGHVDFYPNGGRMQKGCSNLFVGAVSDIIWSSDVEGRSLCNHRRAYKFFTDSVSPRCHFPAFPCESYDDFITGKCFPCSKERKCGNMGYYADRSKGQGQLYLITRDEEPFCAHQYEVRIDSTPSDSHVVSYGKIMITLVGETDINETFIMTQKDDEKLILGESLSKIVVPHPVLGEPMKVELTYIAYSGWLSSGLARWKIDKISLYDSFGKSSSVCQKGLDLETGVPVVLPLYPGECNPPKNNDSSNNKFKSSDIESNQTDDNSWDVSNSSYNEFGFYTRSSLSKFVPTPVVHIGNEAIHNSTHVSTDRKDDIIGDTWTPIGDLNEGGNRNSLDGSFEEKEVSRALNTRAVKIIKTQSHGKNNDQSSIIEKEILEPILKPNSPSNKNSRSHKLYNSEHDSELSEPLLGPTTSRSLSSSTRTYSNTFKFSDFADESDWTPTSNTNYRKKSSDAEKDQKFSASSKEYVNRPTIRLNKETKTRNTNERNFDTYGNDNSNVIRDEIIIKNEPPKEEQPGLVSITVQLLPQRLASMLEQAERYARMTIWPLISVHTPKILTDFVSSLTETTPKYMPLHFEEPEITTTSERDVNKPDGNRINDIKSLDLNSSELNTFTTDAAQSERRISLSDESTELFENLFSDELNQTESIESIESLFSDIINTTLSETFDIDFNKGEVLFENKTLSNTTQEPIIDSYLSSKPLNLGEIYLNETSTEKQSNRTKVYITLPVYEPDPGIQNMTESKDSDENNTRKIKYIPLKYDDKKIDG